MQSVQFGASRSSSPTPSAKQRAKMAEIFTQSKQARALNEAQYPSSSAPKKDLRTPAQQRQDAVEVENTPGMLKKIKNLFKKIK